MGKRFGLFVLVGLVVTPLSLRSTAAPGTQPAATRPAERALTEAQRKAVFADTLAAEDRGRKEADAKYPPKDEASVDANAALWRSLTEKYKNAVAAKHRISREQLRRIAVEGVEKKWPPLND